MKKLLLALSLSSLLLANSSYDIARQLVNNNSKDAKLKLLFPENSYMYDGYPNIKSIVQILKMNSLLKYSFNTAQDMEVKFNTSAKSGILLKVITQAFEQIGVNYYLVSEFKKEDEQSSLAFSINSKFSVDAGALYEALLSMGVRIIDVKREGSKYIYDLDFTRAFIKADHLLNKGGVLELTKPLDAYFIKLDNVSKLSINIGYNNIWYPKIEFLDSNLNLIKTYSSETSVKTLNIAVPKFCAYIVLGDKFTLENIKLGLNIKAN